jgi:hypothetical protein
MALTSVQFAKRSPEQHFQFAFFVSRLSRCFSSAASHVDYLVHHLAPHTSDIFCLDRGHGDYLAGLVDSNATLEKNDNWGPK